MIVRTCLAICVLLPVTPARALAQERSLIDVETGAGYAFGNDVPSLGTVTFGATLWPRRGSWGVSVARVASYGEELFDRPSTSGDVTFLGRANLRYWRLGARHRREVRQRSTLVLGFGVVPRASYENLVRLDENGVVSDRRGEIVWGAVTGELYWDRQLARWFKVRLGVTLDCSADTTILQPIAVAVVTFD